jgi:DNA-binding GntR family transcriptional regulator
MASIQQAPTAFDHGQRRQMVTEALLTEIFQGRLSAGQHLVISDLSKRLGVSSTPVREALVALEGIGIVDSIPNRGAVVRQVTRAEVCQVRRSLECEATRNACGRVDLLQLERLGEAFRTTISSSQRDAAMIERSRALDSQLHDLIAESCGNRFLAKEIGRLKLLFRALRDAAWEYDQANNDHLRSAEEAQEHIAIVEALLAGDRREASRAMAAHIKSGVKYWTRGLPD